MDLPIYCMTISIYRVYCGDEGKIGGIQISHHSRIVIKSDNGGRYPERDNWVRNGGGETRKAKISDMIFQRSLQAQICTQTKIWSTLFDKLWSAHWVMSFQVTVNSLKRVCEVVIIIQTELIIHSSGGDWWVWNLVFCFGTSNVNQLVTMIVLCYYSTINQQDRFYTPWYQ